MWIGPDSQQNRLKRLIDPTQWSKTGQLTPQDMSMYQRQGGPKPDPPLDPNMPILLKRRWLRRQTESMPTNHRRMRETMTLCSPRLIRRINMTSMRFTTKRPKDCHSCKTLTLQLLPIKPLKTKPLKSRIKRLEGPFLPITTGTTS